MFAISTMNDLTGGNAFTQDAGERESLAMLVLATVVSFTAWLVVFSVAAVPMALVALVRWALVRSDDPAEPVHGNAYRG